MNRRQLDDFRRIRCVGGAVVVVLLALMQAMRAQNFSSAQSGSPSWEEDVNTINSPSTVFISVVATRKANTPEEEGLKEPQTGTGFIVSSEGYIISCAHVVPTGPDYESVEVTGAVGGTNETKYPLEEIDREPHHDLVLLRLPQRATPWPSVQRINRPKTGAAILSLGFALGTDLVAVPGSITSTGAKQGYWLTAAELNKGMSGGPVFDKTGGVVAIVRASREEGNGLREIIPISFAIHLLQEVASPALTASSQSVQKSAEKLVKAEENLEEARATLAKGTLDEKEKPRLETQIAEAEKRTAETKDLLADYVELNRTKPAPQSFGERRKIVNEISKSSRGVTDFTKSLLR